MDLIAKLKDEHRLLLQNLEEINAIYTPRADTARTLSAKLYAMKNLLLAHFHLEDTVLFPALAVKMPSGLPAKVQQSLEELHSLTATARDFFARHQTLDDTPSARTVFLRRSNRLPEAPEKRIRVEEKELYPLY